MEQGTFRVKAGLAEMLKGGVIMDVTTPEQAKIAEQAREEVTDHKFEKKEVEVKSNYKSSTYIVAIPVLKRHITRYFDNEDDDSYNEIEKDTLYINSDSDIGEDNYDGEICDITNKINDNDW